ncbi:MAG: Gfo/Idh/MocA family oxidoreductase [Bacteroidetes bacterium]|jgi:predicted dehydrogenase|nr:Gfo/Idh/MocA family oxidoreductase [Bacteroidota bacterium]
MKINRRDLLKSLAPLPLLGVFGFATNWDYRINKKEKIKKNSFINDLNIHPQIPPPPPPIKGKPVKLGVIGTGIRGEQLMWGLGFVHPDAMAYWKKNLPEKLESFRQQEKLNIKITAICDLFDFRANQAMETLGNGGEEPVRYKTYEELLHKADVEAVIIATSDLWHAPIATAAAKAGKHVYVEKPLSHKVNELYQLKKTVEQSGITFQLGHQQRQHQSNYTAREILNKNIAGHINLIQASTNRNSDNGAWQYYTYPEHPESSIDWRNYIKGYYDLPFSREHFFRWRKYWKFGSGLTGDLLTHDYDRMNLITGMGIPRYVTASGGIYTHRDGRNVPDVMQVGMEFPEYFKGSSQKSGKEKGMSFLYSATLGNRFSRETLLMGHDATLELKNDLLLWIDKNSTRYQEVLNQGLVDVNEPIRGFTAENDVDAITSATAQYFANKGLLYDYRDEKLVDITHLHLKEWLSCIRSGNKPSCSINDGFEEAITSLMATLAYKTNQRVEWDRQQQIIQVPGVPNNKLDDLLIKT